MLPETMLRAIALSNVTASDVVDFLNNEVATNERHWTKLPGWLEQPPHPSTPVNNDAAILAASRTDQLDPMDNRSFDLEAPPLRPSTSMVESQKALCPNDESVLQRARMTDEVAAVWNNWPGDSSGTPRPQTIQVTITHAAIPGADSETVPAVLPGASLLSYMNQKWLEDHNIAIITSHPVRKTHLQDGQALRNGNNVEPEAEFLITGEITLRVATRGRQTTRVKFLVFDPAGRDCVLMILNNKSMPREAPAPAATATAQTTTSQQPSGGRMNSRSRLKFPGDEETVYNTPPVPPRRPPAEQRRDMGYGTWSVGPIRRMG